MCINSSHQRRCSNIVRSQGYGQDGILDSFVYAKVDTQRTANQIQTSKGEVIITNDGATILKSIQALHPAAKMVRSQVSFIPFKRH